MPFSLPVFDAAVKALIARMAPASVLDIGPGAGKYGRMVNALRKEGVKVERLAALEIDPGYIARFELASIYDEVRCGDAARLADARSDETFDLVILGDVLEHLKKSDGIDLVDFLYYRVKYLLLVIPIDYIQGAWEGHAHEAHISTWYPSDFARYKATFVEAELADQPSICLVMVNGLRCAAGRDFMFATDAAAAVPELFSSG
jgi:SAM-dependent methyltransferase